MTGGGAPAVDAAVTITNGTISGFSLAANAVALLVMSKLRVLGELARPSPGQRKRDPFAVGIGMTLIGLHKS